MNTEEFSNELSAAQLERLAVLNEECSEVQQAVSKIIRHGYESFNPLPNADKTENREALEKELGHLLNAVRMLCVYDLSNVAIQTHADDKRSTIPRWLHHQAKETL